MEEHVLFCGRRLRAGLTLAVAVLTFTVFAGEAFAVRSAAAPPSFAMSEANDPDEWTGAVEGAVGAPEDCDDVIIPNIDPTLPPDIIVSTNTCSQHFIEAVENGQIRVVVTGDVLPGMDAVNKPSLDVFVFECTQQDLLGNPTNCVRIPDAQLQPTPGPGQNPPGQTQADDEVVIFNATAGNAYEILTVPAFAQAINGTVPTYGGCAEYLTLDEGFCPDPAPAQQPVVPADEFLQDCGTGATGRWKASWGVLQKFADGNKRQSSGNARQDDKTPQADDDDRENKRGNAQLKDDATKTRFHLERWGAMCFIEGTSPDRTGSGNKAVLKGLFEKRVRSENGSVMKSFSCASWELEDNTNPRKNTASGDSVKATFFPFTGDPKNPGAGGSCDTNPAAGETFTINPTEGDVKIKRRAIDED